MGILYYVIYNPLRKRKPRLEVYKLNNGEYQLQQGDIIWLPELNLGIGRALGTYQGIEREWLYWYDSTEKRYEIPEERINNLDEQLIKQRKEKQQLAELLKQYQARFGIIE